MITIVIFLIGMLMVGMPALAALTIMALMWDRLHYLCSMPLRIYMSILGLPNQPPYDGVIGEISFRQTYHEEEYFMIVIVLDGTILVFIMLVLVLFVMLVQHAVLRF